jgi:hypothetical protein
MSNAARFSPFNIQNSPFDIQYSGDLDHRSCTDKRNAHTVLLNPEPYRRNPIASNDLWRQQGLDCCPIRRTAKLGPVCAMPMK